LFFFGMVTPSKLRWWWGVCWSLSLSCFIRSMFRWQEPCKVVGIFFRFRRWSWRTMLGCRQW